jgi:quinol monooxygenase YgiN
MNTGYLINSKRMKLKETHTGSLVLFTILLSFIFCGTVAAQEKKQIVRMAKLVIDSAQLESYKVLLKEGIETAVRVEPGVLLMNAVYEKNNPTHVIVLEVYAGDSAYRAHLQSPHFKKYKMGTKDMVKALELTEVVPIGLESKLK